MRTILKTIMYKMADLSERIVLQIIVSVAATACMATLTSAYLMNDKAEETVVSQAPLSLDPRAAAHLLQANFTEDSFRTGIGDPMEFAALFGPNGDHSFTPPVAREWSAGAAIADARPENPTQAKVRQAAASACGGECNRAPIINVRPPARPNETSLVTMAEVSVPAVEAAQEKSTALLGIPLPSLVPSAEKVATGVAALGESVTSLGESLVDLVLR